MFEATGQFHDLACDSYAKTKLFVVIVWVVIILGYLILWTLAAQT